MCGADWRQGERKGWGVERTGASGDAQLGRTGFVLVSHCATDSWRGAQPQSAWRSEPLFSAGLEARPRTTAKHLPCCLLARATPADYPEWTRTPLLLVSQKWSYQPRSARGVSSGKPKRPKQSRTQEDSPDMRQKQAVPRVVDGHSQWSNSRCALQAPVSVGKQIAHC